MVVLTGTCVAIDGRGILIRGAPGSGKSDLALRLIDGGARLVGDDGVEVRREGPSVVARPPSTIAGRIEVRGLGVLELGAWVEAPLVAIVDLAVSGAVERMPEPAAEEVLGAAIPVFRLAAFEASAPAKVRLAVRLACGDIKACD